MRLLGHEVPLTVSATPSVRYADGLDGARLAAEAEAGADEAAADDAGADDAGGAELADVEADTDAVAVGVAVAVAVGVVGVGVGVGVGVLDLVGVGVGVGVTTAGRTAEGVYTGAVDDEALCEADGEVDALLGALEEDAGAEDVTAAGWSLSWAGGCLVPELRTKTTAPIAPNMTPMIRASMRGRTRRRRGGRFPPPGPDAPYNPTGGVGGALPSGDVGELYPWGGVCDAYPEGGSVPAPAAAVRVGPDSAAT